ncbi:MAG: histidine phosphatase family protein [Desulfobulbaceae bacterium]|nr:histidine phosphatase family protein [Desulfobulbaceae bacterium]
MMIRFLLIRHAATDASTDNLLLGSTDAEAHSSGMAQLNRLPGILEEYSPSLWFCSPMLRALQTAEQLRTLCGIKQVFQVDARLREIDFGQWEQKSFAEIEKNDPDLIPAWSRYDDFVFPGGEAVAGFTGRVAEVLDELRADGSREIGIVTHGGVIRTMICLALGLSPRNYLLFSVLPSSLTVIDLYPEGGVLSALNV